MAQGTVTVMDDGHRLVHATARIVTAQAWRRANGNITERHMVGTAVNGQILVRVAIQAVGRVSTQRDRIDDLLARAVMTGRAGTRTVGRHIVLDPFDLGPG